ncbi:MAG: hypothetical protein WD426_08080, partial [Anditalea sp.]
FPEAFQNLSSKPETLEFANTITWDDTGGHLQGIQLYEEKGETFAYLSGSSATKSYMVKVDLSPPAKVMAIDELMADPYRHAGGFQIFKHYLAVGIEDNYKRTSSKVMIYDIEGGGNDWTSPLYSIEREGPFELATAGAVGITQYRNEMLVAVANWDSRNIDFYACPSPSFKKGEGEFHLKASLATADLPKENWSDPFWGYYQNINLFTDANQNLYLIGFARDDKEQQLADVFQVSFTDSEPGTNDLLKLKRSIQLQKISSKTFECPGGPDFRAGAGLNILNDGSLVLLSSPYQIEPKTSLNFFYSLDRKSLPSEPALGGSFSSFWEKTGELPAEEATQAAAATKSHVYAINNSEVVQYNRSTGEKTGVSSGNASHLNSGFFWKKKLYLAHSNYPNKPDSSDIRILDPKDMELNIFKDFGESEGSLTWAIRHKGDWWCMFVYYGTENHKSYLARFDDDWQEKQRWYFPPEVIAKLGNMSISGGVWKDGGFWVTSHDEKELHRVRLPKTGNRLEYIETVPAPFSGQGIAEDPLTGGLVGIDRSDRKILFAEFGP